LNRKEVGNPSDFFDKNFEDYKTGFSSRGETWLGLETLHKLTSTGAYSLRITMKDFDGQSYVAVYDQFQVGPGDDYVLTVGQFNNILSTLGNALAFDHPPTNINGMKFSTKDRDQDQSNGGWSNGNCAKAMTGGWWYNECTGAHLTGMHAASRSDVDGYKKIFFYHGGNRVPPALTFDSWMEAEMSLVSKTNNGLELIQPVTAIQSSTYQNSLYPERDYPAEKCIDGDTGTDGDADTGPTNDGNMCHTQEPGERSPWLAIDYGTPVTVKRVEIFNRGDCCGWRTNNVDVRVADELPTSANQMFSGGSLLGHFAGPATDGEHIIITGEALSGRYVIVQMDNGEGVPLHLKEVMSFGQ